MERFARVIIGYHGAKASASATYAKKETLVKELHAGKTINTATWNERLSIWIQGPNIHLSVNGFLRHDDSQPADRDDVGDLKTFTPTERS